jgi:hypothetical protein
MCVNIQEMYKGIRGYPGEFDGRMALIEMLDETSEKFLLPVSPADQTSSMKRSQDNGL